MKIKLSAIMANPFRDPAQALNEDKVNFLRASIAESGFWENIPVRKHPTKKNKYQIAYGHHRCSALRADHPRGEFNFQVIKLSDAEMCKQMFLENMGEHRDQNFWQFILDMRALLVAVGKGQIELDEVPARAKKSDLRSAPSAIRHEFLDDRPTGAIIYTSHSIAKFLGEGFLRNGGKEPTAHIKTAITALEAIELCPSNERIIRRAANKSERKCRPVVTESIVTHRRSIKNKEKPSEARKKSLRATAAVAKQIEDIDNEIEETMDARARTTARREVADEDRRSLRREPPKPSFNPVKFADQISYRVDSIIERLDLLLEHIDDREQEELPKVVEKQIQEDYVRIMEAVRERIAPRIKTKGSSKVVQLTKRH